MLKVRLCLLALVAAVPLFELSLLGQGEEKTRPTRTDLTLTLSVGKSRIKVGEPLTLRLEISNAGNSPFFVRGRVLLLEDGITSLNLTLVDEKGKLCPVLRFHEGMFPPQRPRENVFEAVFGEWVLLPPEYSWGTTLTLNDAYFEFLRKPGRYQLSGTYSSVGLDSPAAYQRLGLNRTQIEALPFPSWSGKVHTNTVWIHVLEPAKSSKNSK